MKKNTGILTMIISFFMLLVSVNTSVAGTNVMDGDEIQKQGTITVPLGTTVFDYDKKMIQIGFPYMIKRITSKTSQLNFITLTLEHGVLRNRSKVKSY